MCIHSSIIIIIVRIFLRCLAANFHNFFAFVEITSIFFNAQHRHGFITVFMEKFNVRQQRAKEKKLENNTQKCVCVLEWLAGVNTVIGNRDGAI